MKIHSIKVKDLTFFTFKEIFTLQSDVTDLLMSFVHNIKICKILT